MRVTNFEPANQFIRRQYRKGWGELAVIRKGEARHIIKMN